MGVGPAAGRSGGGGAARAPCTPIAPEAARLVDGLLARVARGRGALDVAVGERLADLSVGEHVLRLGYSGIGDYAREVLGIAARTALQMMQLARELRSRPLLRAAVHRGEVSGRRAVAVLPLARGEHEASWVERARRMTVRELEAEARAAREARTGDPAGALAGAPSPDDEPWEGVTLCVSETTRRRFDEALALAGEILGHTSPRWQRVEVICQEFLGEHPVVPVVPVVPVGLPCDSVQGFQAAGGDHRLDPLKRALEEETQRWSNLLEVEPVAAPVEGLDGGELHGGPGLRPSDPWTLDASLRDLAAMRDRWDELVGQLGLVSRAGRTWKSLGFASFAHYVEERLGLSVRTVEQRIALERRLEDLPALREALRSGRLSYEKARIVARDVAATARGGPDDAKPVDGVPRLDATRSLEAAIRRAAASTCIALRREADTREDAQMRARGLLRLWMPDRVAGLLREAFRAAEGLARGPDECLHLLSSRFVETWVHVREQHRPTPARLAVERDRGFCQVPGCSRPAVHAHHIQFRSRGGSDDLHNLVGVCVAHHLICIHQGWVRVSGQAPDQLTWELGERRLEDLEALEDMEVPMAREAA